MFTPQTPMPTVNSTAIWMISTISSANEIPKPHHHHNGARFISTRLLTSSLSVVSVTSGAMIGASFVSVIAMV